MNNEHKFILINIINEDKLIEMMKGVEKYINNEICAPMRLPDSPYSHSSLTMQWLAEENKKNEQLRTTRTMDFLKQCRIIGTVGNMAPNTYLYGITIYGGRVDLTGVRDFKDDNYYNHFCKFPDTTQIFEEIMKIKDGTDFKEFLEDNEFSKLYNIDFLQRYKCVSSVIFNNFSSLCHKEFQERIFKFVKHHKVIYAKIILNKNIFCINIYGFIIISDDNTLYDIDKILIYSKEKTLSTEYFHKYIKNSDDIYNKYINVSVKSGDNIFFLEQKIKEKKDKEEKEKEEEKNSYKKIIDDLIKEVTNKLDNYNEEMLQYFIKNVSSKDKYIKLYKYYIEEVLNYKKLIGEFKRYILLQFIDDIYNEKYTNDERDLLKRYDLMSYYNGDGSDESFDESFIEDMLKKIFVKLLRDIYLYLYHRGGDKTLALVYILENLSNIKKTILNFDIDEGEFKKKSRKIVSKICDYNKLLSNGITNIYFVFNKEV